MDVHGIAIRVGHEGPAPDAQNFTVHLRDHRCICGEVAYRILADPSHCDMGERFGEHVGRVLKHIHKSGKEHPDVIEIPMSAEFPT
jgi:hypothetical protein